MDETTEALEKEEKELKELSEIRAQENADYQAALADEKASIKVLKKAEEVLAKVYGAKLLLQARADQPKFKTYAKSAGGNKVMTMIATIIADTEKSAEVRIQNEKASQAEYEKAVKDANELSKEKKCICMSDTGFEVCHLPAGYGLFVFANEISYIFTILSSSRVTLCRSGLVFMLKTRQ